MSKAFKPDTDNGVLSYDIRPSDEVVHDLDDLDFYERREDSNIAVAQVNGELSGYVVYEEDSDFVELDIVEVFPFWQGVDFEGDKIAKGLIDYVAEISEDSDKSMVTYCNAGNGKIQYMAQSHGMQISGLKAEQNISDGLTPIMQKPADDFAQIETFLSPEVKEAAEASASPNTGLTYNIPGETGEYALSYEMPENGSSNAVNTELASGDKNIQSIISELEEIQDINPGAWSYTVDFDATEPGAYPLSQNLSNNGWHLINVGENGDATMLKPNRETGPYGVTSETQEFIDSVGLPYRVEAEGTKSNQIKVTSNDSKTQKESMTANKVLQPTNAD